MRPTVMALTDLPGDIAEAMAEAVTDLAAKFSCSSGTLAFPLRCGLRCLVDMAESSSASLPRAELEVLASVPRLGPMELDTTGFEDEGETLAISCSRSDDSPRPCC